MKVIRLENNINSVKELKNIYSNQDVISEIIISMVGERIGNGTYRSVYNYNLDDKYVIKLEKENTDCNIIEYTLWQEIQCLKGNLAWVKDWFAPVLWCSPNGKVLVMEKTKWVDGKTPPQEVPDFFTDIKENNFGWIGSKFVCHDYGFLFRFVKYTKKFRKANW
jgi:hypothetical protein